MDRPTRLPDGRVYRQLEQIRGFIDRQFNGLTAIAVTDPEKLAPEQLERQAQALAAAAYERRTSQAVDPKGFLLSPRERRRAGRVYLPLKTIVTKPRFRLNTFYIDFQDFSEGRLIN
jgi:hypothetical protein